MAPTVALVSHRPQGCRCPPQNQLHAPKTGKTAPLNVTLGKRAAARSVLCGFAASPVPINSWKSLHGGSPADRRIADSTYKKPYVSRRARRGGLAAGRRQVGARSSTSSGPSRPGPSSFGRRNFRLWAGLGVERQSFTAKDAKESIVGIKSPVPSFAGFGLWSCS